MDKKFYVSLEAARLLKEKGYNEQCDYFFYYDDYHDKWDFDSPYNLFDDDPMYYNNETIDDEMYSMPTKTKVVDWLESKCIYIELMFNFEPSIIDHEVLWCYVVYNKIERCGYKENYIFPSRLEAEEAAIIKALKLL